MDLPSLGFTLFDRVAMGVFDWRFAVFRCVTFTSLAFVGATFILDELDGIFCKIFDLNCSHT